MEDAIITNLREILSKPITEECQVVYIMAETRKLLDRLNLRYPLLRFYCSWALHIRIDRLSPAREILETIAEDFKKEREEFKILDFVGLHLLKKEMKAFLESSDLPLDLFEKNKWKRFKHLLINVLQDCPLEGRCDPIEKFLFVKPRVDSEDIDWIIKFPNDPTSYKGSLTEL